MEESGGSLGAGDSFADEASANVEGGASGVNVEVAASTRPCASSCSSKGSQEAYSP